MENPAGSGIKHKFRKEGRPTNRRHGSHLSLGRSVSRGNGNDLSGVNTRESEHPDEHTSLLSKPWQHENAFVRWPGYFGLKTWQTLASNYVNVLLVFVPLGIISGAVGWSPTATFILNFLAIIPLASLLSFATEELAVKLGQTLGGLLNATFGNAVELIVRIPSSQGKKIALMSMTGQYRRPERRPNSHRTSQHARFYPLQYTSRFGLLFPCWRYSLPATDFQWHNGIDYVLAHGRLDRFSHNSSHSIRRNEPIPR